MNSATYKSRPTTELVLAHKAHPHHPAVKSQGNDNLADECHNKQFELELKRILHLLLHNYPIVLRL